jgi:cyclase
LRVPRVIPILLLSKQGLYKTVKFKKPVYIGDPLNAVKIFNEKEVDELIFLDIDASAGGKEPDYRYLTDIASECFMPLCYGGGITNTEQIKKLIFSGIEKVSLNTVALGKPQFIREASDRFGSSTIVVSIDVTKNLFGKNVIYNKNKVKTVFYDPVAMAVEMNKQGAGEILINSVDRDGVMNGYDLELIKRISSQVDIPVVACGGAGEISHFKEADEAGASAVAAGSMFVFHGVHKAVLINYPEQEELRKKMLNE